MASEAVPDELRRRDAELRRRQRARNFAMLIVLLALVALLYAITMVKFRTG